MSDKNAVNTIAAFLSVIILVISGCQKNPVNPAANSSNRTESPSAGNKSNSKIKLFNGRGVVTKINLELVTVELNHEAIEGAMPAMTMEFYVKEKSEIEVLKVGDKVDFVLEENFGQEKITSIKKIQ